MSLLISIRCKCKRLWSECHYHSTDLILMGVWIRLTSFPIVFPSTHLFQPHIFNYFPICIVHSAVKWHRQTTNIWSPVTREAHGAPERGGGLSSLSDCLLWKCNIIQCKHETDAFRSGSVWFQKLKGRFQGNCPSLLINPLIFPDPLNHLLYGFYLPTSWGRNRVPWAPAELEATADSLYSTVTPPFWNLLGSTSAGLTPHILCDDCLGCGVCGYLIYILITFFLCPFWKFLS